MNIMYSIDDNYVCIAGISLMSFFQNNKDETHNIYILDNNISEDNKDKINKIAKEYKSNIFFIDVHQELIKFKQLGIKGFTKQYNLTSCVRLIGIDLLPNDVERILYIDSDTLIIRNINELNSIYMKKPLMMRPDCIHSAYKKHVGMSKKAKYYNSGLMLIDVKMWKKHTCTAKFTNYINKNKNKFTLLDQDIINESLHNEIEDLDLFGYNCQSQMFLFDYKNCLKVYDLSKENYLTQDDYNNTIKEPKILHFCGNSFIRPWYLNSNHPYAKKWNDYFIMSKWKDKKREIYNSSFSDKVRYFLHEHCSKTIEMIISQIANRCYILIKYKV